MRFCIIFWIRVACRRVYPELPLFFLNLPHYPPSGVKIQYRSQNCNLIKNLCNTIWQFCLLSMKSFCLILKYDVWQIRVLSSVMSFCIMFLAFGCKLKDITWIALQLLCLIERQHSNVSRPLFKWFISRHTATSHVPWKCTLKNMLSHFLFSQHHQVEGLQALHVIWNKACWSKWLTSTTVQTWAIPLFLPQYQCSILPKRP